MSLNTSLVTLATVVTAGVVFAGHILLSPTAAFGGEQWETTVSVAPQQQSAAPDLSALPGATVIPGTMVDIPVGPYKPDDKDEIAALERIQYALSEVGDGKTYVWRRWHGKLSGLVQPTSSFKDPSGKVCRHLIVMMTTGINTKRQEGIACRLHSGRWQLEG